MALARLIRRGIEQGEFCAVDAEACAVTLTALYEGMVILYFVDPQALSWPAQIESAVRSLLDGICI